MQLSSDNLRLFGLDLGALWAHYRAGWAEALRWPALAWLTPAEPVRLLQADGSESVWSGGRRMQRTAGPVRFTAVELPEDLVLRRTLVLPELSDAELREAVDLDVRSASPFPMSDLACGHAVRQRSGQRVQVEVALASRRQIAEHLAVTQPLLRGAPAPEVWAAGAPPIVLGGYAEAEREGRAVRDRNRLVVLLLLALALAAAIAVTPTAQLRLQALEASRSTDSLRAAVAPQVRLREQLVAAETNLAHVAQALSQRVDPLPMIDLVTRLMPDDTSLLRLEMRGHTVRVAGQTDNAANLMQILSDQPGVSDVRAPSAATRPRGAAKENFAIDFTVNRKALPE